MEMVVNTLMMDGQSGCRLTMANSDDSQQPGVAMVASKTAGGQQWLAASGEWWQQQLVIMNSDW